MNLLHGMNGPSGHDNTSTHFGHSHNNLLVPGNPNDSNYKENFIDNRDFKELFSMFDWDGGGSIDEDEFNAMLKVLGINIKFPKDPEDPITFPELCALLSHLSKPLTREEELWEAFRFFTSAGSSSSSSGGGPGGLSGTAGPGPNGSKSDDGDHDIIKPKDLLKAYETLGDFTLTEAEARTMLGMGAEMTEEEKEDLKEHGAGLIDDREGISFQEFDYRVIQAKTGPRRSDMMIESSSSHSPKKGMVRT